MVSCPESSVCKMAALARTLVWTVLNTVVLAKVVGGGDPDGWSSRFGVEITAGAAELAAAAVLAEALPSVTRGVDCR